MKGSGATRSGAPAARAIALAAALALGGACVTTYEDTPFLQAPPEPMPVAVAQAIPFRAEAAGGELVGFYDRVLERLQEAAGDRDSGQLEALLDAYERPDLPSWLREVLQGYRQKALGLRFQEHAVKTATLGLVGEVGQDGTAAAVAPPSTPPLGTGLTFHLVVPPGPAPVVLGGRGDEDPCGFCVAVTVEDTFVDGSTRSFRTQDFEWLAASFELAAGSLLRVPVEVDLPAGEAVQRVVHVRIDLMPGYVRVGGVRAPVQRTGLGACAVTQLPAGHEELERAPLEALQRALRLGDAAHFPQVFLAAGFTRGEDREEAIRLLVEQVRFGNPDQALVAMASLRAITGQELAVGDRQAWLAWGQLRR